MPPRRKLAPPGTVIGYVRVSTEEQASSGLGLDAQRAKLADEVARRGLILIDVLADEGISAKALDNRPGLQAALDRIEAGEAQILMVSKLDRLSRSVHDFTGLLKRAEQKGWALIAGDIGVDTSTPAGEAMANVMASFGQLERRLIGQRTSDALQAKKRAGAILGRPERATQEVVDLVAQLRRDGRTLQAIADELNRREIPTSQGGAEWRASSVAAVLRRSASEETS